MTCKPVGKLFACFILMLLLLGLNACNTPRAYPLDATPKAEPRSKYGNPHSYVIAGKRYRVLKTAKHYDKVGKASWYGTKFHGRLTSNRETYNMYAMTAASPTLPIPTYVRVTNLGNGRSVVVRVNDRGPFRKHRILDLSYAAAKKLGYVNKGVAKVRVTAINVAAPQPHTLFAENTLNRALIQTHHAVAPTPSHPMILAHNQAGTYLQVGAYRTRNGAERISEQLTELVKPMRAQVIIKHGNKPGSQLYRVHVGPLPNTAQSKQMAELLAEHGFEKTLAVRS